MTSLTKKCIPQAKNFFRVQTRRLATSFETFIGSVEHTGPEKFPRKTTCIFFPKNPLKRLDAKELKPSYYNLNYFRVFSTITPT